MKINNKFFILVIIIIFVICAYLYNIGTTKTINKDANNINNVDIYNLPKNIIEEKIPSSFSGNIPIFMYHFVNDNNKVDPFIENILKVSSFEEQL
ncbi:MAG: hypothetical protein RSC92_05075, partial [Clostridia bacterium]